MKNFPNVYRQLAALLGAHFFADLVGGLLAGFLPVLLTHFHLDLSLGVIMISSMGIGSNFLQVPAAKIARNKTGPAALVAGMILCASFAILAVLPSSTPLWVLCLIMLFVGFGVALVHPQGLRGVQSLKSIPGSVSTPVFMIGGFIGYAVSPFLGGVLVGNLGMVGLLWILPIPLLVIGAIYLTGVRLVPDSANAKAAVTGEENQIRPPWSFNRMLLIAFFLNTGTVTVTSFVPTLLHGYDGFSLSFGGFCAMLFGLGSACGSLTLGMVVKKIGTEKLVTAGLCVGIPAGALYLMLAAHPAAALLLFVTGFCAAAGFPQLVALLRHVPSRYSMSTMVGMLVGWTWGFAGLSLLVLGLVAEKCSVAAALWLGLASYLAALILVILPRRRAQI